MESRKRRLLMLHFCHAGQGKVFATEKRSFSNLLATSVPQNAGVVKVIQNRLARRVLVIESDPEVADLLARLLKKTNAQRVDHAADGRTGLSMAESLDYALITLDLMLPKFGGPGLCRAIREARRDTPLLAVTARVEAVEDLLGKITGIDDYVLKPVAGRELQRKAEALLARPPSSGPLLHGHTHAEYLAGSVSFDPATRSAAIEGKTIAGLSLAEFELLCFLADNEGVPFSEEELLAMVWNLHPPVRLKHLSVDLSVLRRRIRGMSSGLRYLTLTEDGRTRFDGGAKPW